MGKIYLSLLGGIFLKFTYIWVFGIRTEKIAKILLLIKQKGSWIWNNSSILSSVHMQIILSPEASYSLNHPAILMSHRRETTILCFRITISLFVVEAVIIVTLASFGSQQLWWKYLILQQYPEYKPLLRKTQLHIAFVPIHYSFPHYLTKHYFSENKSVIIKNCN